MVALVHSYIAILAHAAMLWEQANSSVRLYNRYGRFHSIPSCQSLLWCRVHFRYSTRSHERPVPCEAEVSELAFCSVHVLFPRKTAKHNRFGLPQLDRPAPPHHIRLCALVFPVGLHDQWRFYGLCDLDGRLG